MIFHHKEAHSALMTRIDTHIETYLRVARSDDRRVYRESLLNSATESFGIRQNIVAHFSMWIRHLKFVKGSGTAVEKRLMRRSICRVFAGSCVKCYRATRRSVKPADRCARRYHPAPNAISGTSSERTSASKPNNFSNRIS